VISSRGWLELDFPEGWIRAAPGRWRGPGGGRIHLDDILESAQPIESAGAVEAHEAWCEGNAVNSRQTRMEETPSGVTVLRSFGEARSDEFVMVAHLWEGRRLSLLEFRSPLERLSDQDLAGVLAALLDAHPTGRETE
jgi:hypothetical protein